MLGDRLFAALAAACLVSTAILFEAEQVHAWARETLGDAMSSAIAAEGLLALLAFAPPTFVMGALFSHLSHAASAAGISFGRSLGVNTLAAAVAPARNAHASSRVEEMLAQVREPLLSVLRISPDFLPAYDPLLAMSRALLRTDTAAARSLLGELARLQPARAEATQMLSLIDDATSRVAPVRH